MAIVIIQLLYIYIYSIIVYSGKHDLFVPDMELQGMDVLICKLICWLGPCAFGEIGGRTHDEGNGSTRKTMYYYYYCFSINAWITMSGLATSAPYPPKFRCKIVKNLQHSPNRPWQYLWSVQVALAVCFSGWFGPHPFAGAGGKRSSTHQNPSAQGRLGSFFFSVRKTRRQVEMWLVHRCEVEGRKARIGCIMIDHTRVRGFMVYSQPLLGINDWIHWIICFKWLPTSDHDLMVHLWLFTVRGSPMSNSFLSHKSREIATDSLTVAKKIVCLKGCFDGLWWTKSWNSCQITSNNKIICLWPSPRWFALNTVLKPSTPAPKDKTATFWIVEVIEAISGGFAFLGAWVFQGRAI